MKKYILKLYVTGQSLYSDKAIANLKRIEEEAFQGDCEISIVDVLEHPDLAEMDKILATPTLIRAFPEPARRVIGDLSDITTLIKVSVKHFVPKWVVN